MKKTIAALTMVIGTSSHAGFGGMGNVDSDESGASGIGDIALGGLLIVGIYLVWKKLFG